MTTVSKFIPQGRGLAAVLLKRSPTVELDWSQRQAGRFDAADSSGRALGVQLPQGTALRGGDVLLAEDGSLVRVQAAREAVLAVRPCAEHGSPADLVRAAYHLGRRQVALDLQPDHLRLQPDPALAQWLRRQHLVVTEASEPFEPEADAPGEAGHAHDHGHAHAHAHGHDHGHSHHAPGHVHGPGCDHEH